MQKRPPLSIIIVTLNSQRTLRQCLRYIEKQNYSEIKEVLIVDGGSSDETKKIARLSNLPIKIIDGGYRDNQEARRALGVEKAKSELCAFIDSDNYILDRNWLKDMIEPFMKNNSIIASQTLRYAVPKKASILNRYFGLIGAADPVAYYLGKDDRLSWSFENWNLLGNVIEENEKYYVIEFQQDQYPTVGCNGVLFRRSILMKSKWKKPEDYIHTDVFIDIGKLGFNKFAIVKNEIYHNTADNIWNFFAKRRRYMRIYHQKLNKTRRHLIFDPKKTADVKRLIIFHPHHEKIRRKRCENIFPYDPIRPLPVRCEKRMESRKDETSPDARGPRGRRLEKGLRRGDRR